MRTLISLIITGAIVSLANLSEAHAETCDSLTNRFLQVLEDDGLEPVVSHAVRDMTQTTLITVSLDYEPTSYGMILRKGYHGRTYGFKYISNSYTDTPDGCMLDRIDFFFNPLDKNWSEESSVSAPECLLHAKAYDDEEIRKEELLRQGKLYIPPSYLMDSNTDKFGHICSQVNQILHPTIQALTHQQILQSLGQYIKTETIPIPITPNRIYLIPSAKSIYPENIPTTKRGN